MKHPERVEDYLEHIAEAIDRVAVYLQPVPDLEASQMSPQVGPMLLSEIPVFCPELRCTAPAASAVSWKR